MDIVQPEILSSDKRMKWLKIGEHHFSMCQIMISETSSCSAFQFSRTRLFSASSVLTATSGQIVYPIPRFKQPLSPLTLENRSIRVPISFCLSDRPKYLG
jgi:hypothetical protein